MVACFLRFSGSVPNPYFDVGLPSPSSVPSLLHFDSTPSAVSVHVLLRWVYEWEPLKWKGIMVDQALRVYGVNDSNPTELPAELWTHSFHGF